MAKIFRDLIEYNNINEICMKEVENFRQSSIDCNFYIPVQKPDIEEIVKVWTEPCIKNEKIVRTPVGVSLEGQRVTGYKYLIEGSIFLKVEYVGLVKEQTLHTAHTEIPFCSYVVLPEGFNPSALVTANVIIEDINSVKLNERGIYNTITFMTIADIC